METTETSFEMVIDFRDSHSARDFHEPTGGVIATFYGRAVPYGETTVIDGVEESFAPGAFNPADAIGLPIAWRHGDPVGVITHATNEPDGLYITGDILGTVVGRDAAVLAKAKAVKGLSVGYQQIKSLRNKTGSAIQHVTAKLLEVSLTHMPAYAGAGITSIREEEVNVMETLEITPGTMVSEDVQAREAIASVREQLAQIEARAFVTETAHPLAQYRTLGDYSKAVYAGDVDTRALFDQVTADNPGVIPPAWLMDVKGIIDRGRPVISGLGGPQSAGESGMDINWPFFDGDLTAIVAAQANEKDEVNSVQISLEKGTATLATYSAGSDISYQLLQRSAPSYLDAHNRIMLASYGVVTDRKFTADLWNNGTGVEDYVFSTDTDGSAFREAVFSSSVTVEDATGAPATAVFVSTAVFKAIGGWSTFLPAPTGVQNVSGTATASTLKVDVSGLRVIRAKWLDTNATYDAIVTNGEAARWIEDGPRLVNAENVGKLGHDVAVYGYGVSAEYLPAGIVRVYDVP